MTSVSEVLLDLPIDKFEHPYSRLPPRNFWHSVATSHHSEWCDVYRKKFEIAPSDKIAAAGSCFAQHIGRELKSRGFRFLDREPAPRELPRECHGDFGYGLYSARYGNVYTARQLLQLFQEATGTRSPTVRIWEKDGRFYDPLRPSVEPSGFASSEEVLALRENHLQIVRRLFAGCSVFVFTLGLTEAWVSKSDGTVYPVCPGTQAGRFDSDLYEFRNFTYGEIWADMVHFIEGMRELNNRVRFIFTVSPVPLTATATEQHILSASSYSKSVLRAVAGDLYQAFPYVDYFPSYELVSSHATRGDHFSPNLRTVVRSGVSEVMGHFFAEHAAPPPKVPRQRKSELAVDRTICDEEALATVGR